MGVWNFAPAPLAAGIAALVLYWQAYSRLRARRRDLARPGNAALFTAGVLVAVLALVSPLDDLGETKLLSAHMLQHLLLADVAALLIVLGLRGPMSVFIVPARPLRSLAAVRPLRRLASFLLRPSTAFCIWVIAIAAWHVPAAYDAAIAHPALHAVEHATFLLAGLLVWTQIIDPTRHGRRAPGRRAVLAAAVLIAGAAMSEVLLLAGPLYPHYEHVLNRPFGWTAAEDQRRAALLMMGEQIATLGTAAALLLWSHAEKVERELEGAYPLGSDETT